MPEKVTIMAATGPIVRFNKNRFCNGSCAAKWRMSQTTIREKMFTPERAEKLRVATQRHWDTQTPSPQSAWRRSQRGGFIQGGNGRGMTKAQKVLLAALPTGWVIEYSISIKGCYWTPEYPSHYKVDLANPYQHLAVEIDGFSHKAGPQQARDKKKDKKLLELGWSVLRFWNWDIQSSLDSVVTEIMSHCTTSP